MQSPELGTRRTINNVSLHPEAFSYSLGENVMLRNEIILANNISISTKYATSYVSKCQREAV